MTQPAATKPTRDREWADAYAIASRRSDANTPPAPRKPRLSAQARRAMRDYLMQRITRTVYRYEYALHPDDERIVMVLTMRPLAPRGHSQDWQMYYAFGSAQSAATALHALRQAQAREEVTA